MKNLIIWLVILIALIGVTIGAVWFMKVGPFAVNPPNEATDSIPSIAPLSSSTPTGEVSEESIVEISNFSYKPNSLTIKKGTSVTWTNRDSVGHNAAGDDNSWKTEILPSGTSGSITFNEVGTFPYHCTPHPFMKGVIIVIE